MIATKDKTKRLALRKWKAAEYHRARQKIRTCAEPVANDDYVRESHFPPEAQALFRNSSLSKTEIILAILIYNHSQDDPKGWFAHNRVLGQRVGLTQLRSVRRCLANLEKAGVVITTIDEEGNRRLKTTWEPLAPTAKTKEPIKILASKLRPEEVARDILASDTIDGVCQLRYWRRKFYRWSDGGYREVFPNDFVSHVGKWIIARAYKVGRGIVYKVVAQVKAQASFPADKELPHRLGGYAPPATVAKSDK